MNQGPGEQQQAPGQESGESSGAKGSGLEILPGALSGLRCPLWRGACPGDLEHRTTPASLDKRPSASMGLGHMRPGCQQLASVAANPQTPPSSHHHCEDPPVLPSVKGDPFTDGRTGGRPPGDGFCPSRGWLVSGQYAGAPRHSQVHPHKCLSGQRAPHLRYQARFPVSLTLHPANGRPPCHPEGHAFSHGPPLPAVSRPH